MPSERFDFPGADGGTLAGRLDLPSGKVRAYALFAHCFTCGKDIFAARRIAETLTARGYGVLRFDFTGLGHSEGEFANTTFTSNVQDLVAAARALGARDREPALLIGHSLGGAAVLAAAGDLASVKAVATIGAPHDPGHVTHLFQEARERIEREGVGPVTIAGRTFRIGRGFLEDIAAHAQDRNISGLRRPLLVMHAPLDAVVGIENATAIFRAAKHPKSFVSLDTADHLLSRRADAVYAAGVVSAWAARYVDAEEEVPRKPTAGEEGEILVRSTGEGDFQQEILAGEHRLLGDEPVAAGGTATGPTPYDYLLAALGTCTSMTVGMYARRKGWPLAGTRVRLSHARIHAEDCADCESRDTQIGEITLHIAFDGPDLTAEQRERLMEIAGKCPVHKTLIGEIKIRLRTEEAG